MRSRRLLTRALPVTAVLLAVLLVACGGGEDAAPTATPTATPAAIPTQTPPPTSTTEPPGILTGTWELRIRITAADGACLGEAFDPPYVEKIAIVQTGEEVTVTGITDAIVPFWVGTFDGSKLSFDGSKARHTLTGSRDDARHGPGTTLSTFELFYDVETDQLRGTESWSWSGDAGVCDSGQSDITGRRITLLQVTEDSPAAARLAALAEGTDFPDAETVKRVEFYFAQFERSCPDDSDGNFLEYVVTSHRTVIEAGVEKDLVFVSSWLANGIRLYPRLSCAEAAIVLTEALTKFELTGELPVVPTPFAGAIAPEDKPRLGSMFPDGIEFTRNAAYLDIENRGHSESAFLFEVAAGTDILSPVSGLVRDALSDFVVLIDDATGSLVVISSLIREVEGGARVEAGERIGSVSSASTLVVAIAAPGGGTRPKVDVTLDPESWWD